MPTYLDTGAEIEVGDWVVSTRGPREDWDVGEVTAVEGLHVAVRWIESGASAFGHASVVDKCAPYATRAAAESALRQARAVAEVEPVTDGQIRAFRSEAGSAGDMVAYGLATVALGGEFTLNLERALCAAGFREIAFRPSSDASIARARAEVERAIREARARA